ncbi:MAG: hypothetical protein ACOH2L_15255 [Devosia sp.]
MPGRFCLWLHAVAAMTRAGSGPAKPLPYRGGGKLSPVGWQARPGKFTAIPFRFDFLTYIMINHARADNDRVGSGQIFDVSDVLYKTGLARG